jgi:hypothetical protein
MDPASGVGAAKTAMGAGEVAYKGWGWFWKWWYGTVAITQPGNRDAVRSEWVHMSGTHANARGKYWLFTRNWDDYWPHGRVHLEPDGRWKGTVNVNPSPGPRTSTIVLAWVSDFLDTLLSDIKDRSKRANFYGPVKMKTPKSQFWKVQSIVVNVEIPASKT